MYYSTPCRTFASRNIESLQRKLLTVSRFAFLLCKRLSPTSQILPYSVIMGRASIRCLKHMGVKYAKNVVFGTFRTFWVIEQGQERPFSRFLGARLVQRLAVSAYCLLNVLSCRKERHLTNLTAHQLLLIDILLR